jgi:hypothetical protein
MAGYNPTESVNSARSSVRKGREFPSAGRHNKWLFNVGDEDVPEY